MSRIRMFILKMFGISQSKKAIEQGRLTLEGIKKGLK